MPVVSVCPVHGPFISQQLRIKQATDVTFVGNADSCPICKAPSRMMDGNFNFDAEGLVTILSAPQWTRQALQEVAGALADGARIIEDAASTKEREKALRDVIDNLAATNQILAQTVQQLTQTKKRPWSKIVALLNALAAAVTIALGAPTLMEFAESAGDQVRHAVEQFLSDVPTSPGPTTPPSTPAR